MDLARGYLSTSSVIEMLPMVEMGVTIHIDGTEINSRNVGRYRRRYEQQLARIEHELKQRGYEDISGAYSSQTTESCGRIKATFAFLRNVEVGGIDINQNGLEATIVLHFIDEGNEQISIPFDAVIAGKGMAIADPMNSDYFYLGMIGGGGILIYPDYSVVNSWPEWAVPPKLEDLQNCTITLSRAATK
jgi:hypothetical protein